MNDEVTKFINENAIKLNFNTYCLLHTDLKKVFIYEKINIKDRGYKQLVVISFDEFQKIKDEYSRIAEGT